MEKLSRQPIVSAGGAPSDYFLSLHEKNAVEFNALAATDTGWTESTGVADKGAFNTATATAQDCAERIKALEDLLRSRGILDG